MSIFRKNDKMYLTVNEFVKTNHLNLLVPLEEELTEGVDENGEPWTEKTYTYELEELRKFLDSLSYWAVHNYRVSEIKQIEFTEEQKKLYLPMAFMMACIDGNAFPGLIEQYIPDAVSIIRDNGWDDEAVAKLEETNKSCFN